MRVIGLGGSACLCNGASFDTKHSSEHALESVHEYSLASRCDTHGRRVWVGWLGLAAFRRW